MIRVLIKLGLLCASLLLVFLVMEIVLRLSGYGSVGTRRGNVVRHVVDEYDHLAVLNSLDLRDEEIGPKAAGEFRILVVGDSFTYGYGVEEPDTFVRRTEDLVRTEAAIAGSTIDYRVINGGIGGGPFRQEQWLREVGLGLEPDLVVEAFFIGNDIYDDLSWRRGRRGTGGGASRPRSVFLDWSWSRLVAIPTFDRLLFGVGLRYSDRGLFLRDQPQLEREAWAASLAKIREIGELLDGAGVSFLVLIVPTVDQVRFGADRPDAEDYLLPNEILSEFLSEHGIGTLDLLPLIERNVGKDDFYYRRNLHWTAEGHRFAAEVLAERLESLQFSGER